MSDDAPPVKCPAGIPGWVLTFADLMSLLMCFFVLLLSFSEMDVQKYKQIAGSMKNAFGVQTLVEAKSIPKGTSVVAQEFSPGKPEPTLIPKVQQTTTEDWKENLDSGEADAQKDAAQAQSAADADAQAESEQDGQKKAGSDESTEQFLKIQAALAEEISQGLLDVETQDGKIIIRIDEKGSFPSGTAKLNRDFQPIMAKISDAILTTNGQIHVSGHTDNIPIKTKRFRSNWELSSARSVTVLHQLMKFNDFDQSRFTIEGMADSKPLDSNDTPEGRANNRRVEIVIHEED